MMNRREFLKTSALLGTALASPLALPGCASLSHRVKPAEFPLSPGESILLTNGRIVDVERSRIVSPGHIFIRDALIQEISTGSDVPKADISIDLGGHFVIPGLINSHCHIMLPCVLHFGPKTFFNLKRQAQRNAQECLRHGVTTVRDMFGLTGMINDLRREISSGRLLGPRILKCTAIQVPGGYNAGLDLIAGPESLRIVNSPGEASAAVAGAVARGADFIKVFLQYNSLWIPTPPLNVMDREILTAIREEADRHGRTVACHHKTIEGFRAALHTGIHSLEHISADEIIPDREIEEYVKKGLAISPTMSVAWGLSYERHDDPYRDRPIVREILEDRRKKLERMLDEFTEEPIKNIAMKVYHRYSDPDYFERKHLLPPLEPKLYTSTAVNGKENLLRMVKAGIVMGCGNDGGVPWIFPGGLALEMNLLQQLGVSPPEILKMATINNAKILRMEDRIGAIRKGTIADLVVLSGNPLKDTQNLWKVEKVFFEGRLKYSA